MKERDIPFTILDNPFHLTDEVCQKLKEYGCEKYQLSLDGVRETHDWFRNPGSFDVTLEKIGCINRAGIRSVIMTTVSGMNIKEVPDIIDAAVHGIYVSPDAWIDAMYLIHMRCSHGVFLFHYR